LAVEAGIKGDETLLKQAMLLDPLTGAVLNPAEVWQMTDEMLIAQEKWLPQYTETIKAAKERMAKGDLIPTKINKGAARLAIKTVEVMAQEADKMRKLASAAAKEHVE